MRSFNLFRLLWRLTWLHAGFFLVPAAAHAISVTCSSSATNINFGSVNGLATGTSSTGTVSWTCNNTGGGQSAYVTFCLNIGSGTGGTSGSARLLVGGTPSLQFQLYQDAANTQIWGSLLSGPNTTPYQTQFIIPANGAYTGSATVHGAIPNGQSGITPGSYSSTFSTTNSAVSGTYNAGGSTYPSTCGTANSGIYFPFTVTATVVKQCLVTAGANLNFGTVPSTQANISATNNVTVTCTNTTPYFIGMSPSNGNTAGAGTMSGITIPTNKVAYQLYSNVGLTTVWGNTATSSSVGNGVGGTGNGTSQSIPVWAQAPSANYVPDSYVDTVTINVNY
ncbi:MAG: spore coat protein U domain-containing protein [Thiobacillaceae bacterium]